jgi:hypothetical protein
LAGVVIATIIAFAVLCGVLAWIAVVVIEDRQ